VLREHHAGMNEINEAFDWQAKAYDDGASPFNYFSPLIENLHRDPRHSAELRRMQLRAWAKDPSLSGFGSTTTPHDSPAGREPGADRRRRP
jgi:hypothetical protein